VIIDIKKKNAVSSVSLVCHAQLNPIDAEDLQSVAVKLAQITTKRIKISKESINKHL